MEVVLAENYGFCFGVKRAILLAEKHKNSYTLGPLIHNPKEIDRLKVNFNVHMEEDVKKLKEKEKVIVRTHGIEKEKKAYLLENNFDVIDATCPFVTKPQEIAEQMSQKGYDLIIFGDAAHPEVKGVKSYAKVAHVVSCVDELEKLSLGKKVALISQTTKKIENFTKIANYLITNTRETRVFNTICNATFDNQKAIAKLSLEVDVMIVIGGKNSSNTKQLLSIAKNNCEDSYLIEDEKDIEKQWFLNKKKCGISAGASTPDWIIQNVVNKIRKI